MGTAASIKNSGRRQICRKCRSMQVGTRHCETCSGLLCQECCSHRGQFTDSLNRNSLGSNQTVRGAGRFHRRLHNDRRQEMFSRKLLVPNPVRNSYRTASVKSTASVRTYDATERNYERLETRPLHDLQASYSRMFYDRGIGGRTSNVSINMDNEFDVRSARTRTSLRSDVLELDTNTSLSQSTGRPQSFRYETGSRDMSLRPKSFRSETNDRLGRRFQHQPINTKWRPDKHESKMFKFFAPGLLQPRRSRLRAEKDTNLFGQNAIPCETDALQEHPCATADQKIAECVTHTHDGKLVILSSYYFKESLCACCTAKTFIVLSFPRDADIPFSDFIHLTDCGDMTSSTSVEKTYFTLPKWRTVYTFCKGSNIYEAFKTPGECYGISYFDKGLAISVRLQADFHIVNTWMIMFVRYNGKMKRRIVDNYNGKLLFKEPKYLASNHSGDTLYVSDLGKRAIIAFNVWGAVLFEYTDTELFFPRGITVDADDNIYVADGPNVLQIKANGTLSNTLLSTNNDQEIADLSFDKRARLLIVVQRNGTITEFSFSK